MPAVNAMTGDLKKAFARGRSSSYMVNAHDSAVKEDWPDMRVYRASVADASGSGVKRRRKTAGSSNAVTGAIVQPLQPR